MDKKLYAVTAIFDKPDDIKHAAEAAVKEGYSKFDINTPYPIHGIEKAMNLKQSMIGFVTLFIGLGGAAFAFLFMTWVTSINYPLVIGGKPFFTWPAFVPITFEVTVLSAAVSTVIAMLFFMFRLPHTSHPLHDTDYMKKVSSDKFGICITAIDPIFEERKVKAFLASLSGKDVGVVYEPEPEEIKMFDPKFVAMLVITALVTGGASYFVLNKLLYMEPFTWMWFQPKVVTQSASTLFPDGFSMRMPVEGTVPRGFIPYEYKGMPDSLVKLLSNPMPFTKEVIDKGKKRYDTYCSPCHGYYGKGDSRLRNQFPNPPSLHNEKVMKWADGNIYNVITNGQNVMPSYEKSISRDDRWAVVHYVRVLQRSQNAKDSDVEAK
jgi:hypothetical protein